MFNKHPDVYVKEVDRSEYVIPEPSKEEYRGKRKPKNKKKDSYRKDRELDNWN
jgi:hypothetical protein